MNRMEKIHLDELPERCRREIQSFFQKPHSDLDVNLQNKSALYRNPDDYLILASKEKKDNNYTKWQTSFLKKSDVHTFIRYNPNYCRQYYLVWDETMQPHSGPARLIDSGRFCT